MQFKNSVVLHAADFWKLVTATRNEISKEMVL